MSKRAITQSLKGLTAAAKKLWREGEILREEILDRLDQSLDRAWRLGQILNRIKGLVGHGNWLLWLESNWPDLSDRQAQRFMRLDRENPDARGIKDLSPDSVRKFRLGYVPEKERPLLEGDVPISRPVHHLTLVNDWRRLQRRMEIGQASIDPEEARKDLRPIFEWMCQLYGISTPPSQELVTK